MYLQNGDKTTCFGCKACGDRCPVHAIRYEFDEEGAWYPVIDSGKCISCGKCADICPKGKQPRAAKCEIYGGWHRESALRDKSSSGGIFFELAKAVLVQGGAVVGAAFDEAFAVHHVVIDRIDQLPLLQRSKYVQSDTEGVFLEVQKLLKQGRTVLFSGTPCQVAAMRAFCPEESLPLILVEVNCFGVPSPVVYRGYLNYLQQHRGTSISGINFKDKRYGWDYYTTEIAFSNGKTECVFGGDSYKQFMHRGFSLRAACFHCDYPLTKRFADISLGDFYHYQNYMTAEAPKNGVSCVIVRSKRGSELLRLVQKDLVLYPVDADRFFKNEIVGKSKTVPHDRAQFYHLLNQNGYGCCLPLLPKKSLPYRIKRWLRSLRKRWFYK